jgi:MFS family permease
MGEREAMATSGNERAPGGGAAAAVPAATAPQRSGLVLVSLILVAAVANLNLSVANVALPDIGKAFDASQTTLDLIAVGYSLGLAASVLWLGALGDRCGRKLLLVLGVVLSVPACLLAAYAPSDGVLIVARLLGGFSAGMAFPTTLALITALWSGPGRTRSIALWSGTGGAIASLGPLLSGWLLESFWWGSVFLITLPLAVVALLMALAFVPAHVNETTDPVDNLGGVLSALLVAALILAINFAPVPNKGALVLGLAVVAVAAGIAFLIRPRRVTNPLYDLNVAGRRIFWVAACAGIIVFGALMGAMFVGQQFLQNVLGYSTFHAGLAILPAAICMVLVAAPFGQARGCPRRPVHAAHRLSVLSARLPHHAAVMEGAQLLLAGRLGLRAGRDRCRVRRHACVALPHRVGPGAAGWDGVGHRRPATRPGWRDHARCRTWPRSSRSPPTARHARPAARTPSGRPAPAARAGTSPVWS